VRGVVLKLDGQVAILYLRRLKYEKVDLAFESNYQPVEKHLNYLFEILSYCIEKEKQDEERARAGGERELNDWT
jgi:hypothetical protein